MTDITEHCDTRVTTSWHTYPTIYALGHRALRPLLDGVVQVEEKVDGSQFSFGVFNGHLRIKSKGKEIFLDAPEKMFLTGIEYVTSIQDKLVDGYTYRAEFLSRPKHNVLAYERAPANSLIIFDINDGHESYLPYEAKLAEAQRIGLECVPLLFQGTLKDYAQFQTYLDTLSVLGAQKVEGVVVKNYTQYGPDKKTLMGKFVSEFFKETHAHEWKKQNPSQNDIFVTLENKYKTPARWAKAVQHLRERGVLENSPRDIGLLIKEASEDVLKECEADIVDDLREWALPKVKRALIRGLPEWYKEQLAHAQFEGE